jgi:hypothetical protein
VKSDDPLRTHLINLLHWDDAHAGFDRAVDNVPVVTRGRVPQGAPHSLWQIVEHLRLAQNDILDFCINPSYREKAWPADYWPAVAPKGEEEWNAAIDSYRRDRKALEKLIASPKTDLFATIPHGSGQTYLREVLLVADHTAYHVGQLVIVRRLLGIWPD